ncbi:MAG TPA: heavy-metal-associated domain-containing protein, partial [Pirellulales bacterium]|nr:heavy-metal-associated domain-containing protein [Pirellulales bacterium]
MNASGATTSSTFYVPALDCPEELALIEKGLRRLEGVVDLAPDYLNRRLAVEYVVPRLDALTIAAQIRQMGFAAEVVSHETVGSAARPYLRRTTLTGAVLLGLAFATSLLASSPIAG